MSAEDFQKLRQIILQNSDLQNELQRLIEREDFISKLIEIGCKFGLQFESQDVLQTMREARQVWVNRWL